jgi:hypothetical protein
MSGSSSRTPHSRHSERLDSRDARHAVCEAVTCLTLNTAVGTLGVTLNLARRASRQDPCLRGVFDWCAPGCAQLGWLNLGHVDRGVIVPRKNPNEFRRKVLDLVEAGCR